MLHEDCVIRKVFHDSFDVFLYKRERCRIYMLHNPVCEICKACKECGLFNMVTNMMIGSN